MSSELTTNELSPILAKQLTTSVVQNSDKLHAKPFDVVQDIQPQPINEYEKNMLKGTLNADQLLEREKELANNPRELTDEEKEFIRKRDYITKVKVIANNMLDKHPTANPSFYTKKEKQRMVELMEYVIGNYNDDDLTKEFNEICNDKLFVDGFDYSTLPVYNYNINNTPLYDA